MYLSIYSSVSNAYLNYLLIETLKFHQRIISTKRLVYIFISIYTGFSPDQALWDYIWRLGMAVYILLRISECLNPVFYNLSSRLVRTVLVLAVLIIVYLLSFFDQSRERGDIPIFESSCHQLSCLPQMAEVSHCPFLLSSR